MTRSAGADSASVVFDALQSAQARGIDILIADTALNLGAETGTKLIQMARRSGHAVIFGGAPGGIPDPASAPLQSPRSHQLKAALEMAGYGEERARALAQKSGGNLGSLLRCLQNLSLMPEWADGSAAAELAIATVLGSWDEKSESDRVVVENVSGVVKNVRAVVESISAVVASVSGRMLCILDSSRQSRRFGYVGRRNSPHRRQ